MVVVLLVIGIVGFYFWNKIISYVIIDNVKVNGD